MTGSRRVSACVVLIVAVVVALGSPPTRSHHPHLHYACLTTQLKLDQLFAHEYDLFSSLRAQVALSIRRGLRYRRRCVVVG